MSETEKERRESTEDRPTDRIDRTDDFGPCMHMYVCMQWPVQIAMDVSLEGLRLN